MTPGNRRKSSDPFLHGAATLIDRVADDERPDDPPRLQENSDQLIREPSYSSAATLRYLPPLYPPRRHDNELTAASIRGRLPGYPLLVDDVLGSLIT
jgi:hypothetical protein